MDTVNGFWILMVPWKGPQRTKIFPGEGNDYPVGTKVSVAAFTKKEKRLHVFLSLLYLDTKRMNIKQKKKY